MKLFFNIVMTASLLVGQFAVPSNIASLPALQEPPTLTVTPTETQTTNITPTLTASPTDTIPVPSGTQAGTSTQTPSPLITETATPSQAYPTLGTPVPTQISPSTEAVLTLRVEPEFLKPGKPVNLKWEISGTTDVEKEAKTSSYILQIIFPDGVTPELNKNSKYDKSSGILTLPLSRNKGQVQINIAQTLADQTTFTAILLKKEEVITQASLTLASKEEFSLRASGGELQSADGKVEVKFPLGAIKEDVLVQFGNPNSDTMPAFSLSGEPFELKAQGQTSKQALNQFETPIEIKVDYGDLKFSPQEESNLYLYWYNPETGEWLALPSSVNPETNVLTAETTHFTVFDVGVNNWQSAHTPMIEGFQASEFTGAATYSFPIEVPPGPGGLQPSLSLNYNSQVVDQATFNTQASWVGMGWSLATNSIELDTHGTDDWANDDTYYLNVAGVSTRLVKDNSGVLHTEDENYWRITPDGNTWKVWDKSGNVYTFAYTSQMMNNACTPVTYQWWLTSVTNIYGKSLTYDYTKETKTIPCGVVDTAIYPATITYPNNRYQVQFVKTARADYPIGWDTDAAPHSYYRSRLSEINIKQDANGAGNGDGVFEKLVRQYQLTYAPNSATTGRIYPGYTYTGGDKTLTLKYIGQYGVDGVGIMGTSSEPITELNLTYGDQLHLTKATNSDGGRVEFDYTPYTELGGTSESLITNYDFGTTNNCPAISNNYWHVYNDYQWIGGVWVECNVADPALLVGGNAMAVNTNVTYGGDMQMVRPGGTYRLSATATLDTNAQWKIGLGDGVNSDQLTGWNTGTSISTVFTLPLNAVAMWPIIQSYGWNTHVTNFKIELLPTYHRVSEKRVYASPSADPYTFGYNYTSPAMNDASHSEIVDNCPPNSGCKKYASEYSEFRGHQKVIVTGPDGRKTETTFWQDDNLKGRAKEIQIKNGSTLLRSTLYTYAVGTPLEMAPLTTSGGAQTYVGVERRFTYTSAEENRVYNQAGTYSSTSTTHGSPDSYGNLTHHEEFANGVLYRKTDYFYFPNVSTTRYLVSLPAKVKVFDASNTELAITLYFYDDQVNHELNHQLPPIDGKLNAVRTLSGTDNQKYAQTSYAHDSWGNQTVVENYKEYVNWNFALFPSYPQSTQTEYDLTYHTYPVKITNAKGQFTTVAYDYTLGLPISETDPNNATTSATYDPFGRMTNLIRPLNDALTSISFSYPVVHFYPYQANLTLQVDSGHTYIVQQTYDGIGRQIQTNAGGVKTDYTYDAYGRVLTQSVPYSGTSPSAVTSTTYDVLGRPLSITPPDNISTSYSYNGLITTVTEPDTSGGVTTHVTTTTTDERGRTISLVPPTGPSVTYTYDQLDRLNTVVRGGLTTTLTYDYAGHKISMTDPDMGNWTYEYNAVGNLETQEDALHCELNMSYDLLNRLLSKTSGTGCATTVNTTYAYDSGTNGIGRRTSMTDASGSTAWIYDQRGRLFRETKTISGAAAPFVTEYTYNLADLPVTIKYPDGEVVTQSYDSKMLPESLTSTLNTYVSSTDYDDAGRLTLRNYGNNTQTSYIYNPWNVQGGRLQQIISRQTTTNYVFQSLNYAYDNAGNVQSIQNAVAGPGETQSYLYDSLNRLTTWKLNGVTQETYSYNATTGNLATKNGTTYTYGLTSGNSNHKVTSASSSSFTYDANGNMDQRTVNGAVADLDYDAEGRLISVTGNAPTSTLVAGPSPTPIAATPTATLPPTSTKTYTPTPTKTVTPSRTPTPSATTTPTPIFADVTTGFYKPYIEKIYTEGITGGCTTSPLNYCPTTYVTRDQMAILLLRAEHGAGYAPPAVGASTGFADVPTSHWAAAWIKQLAAEGITSGCGGGNYCPSTNVSREQFAIFVLRTKNGSTWNPPSYSTYTFTDIAASTFKNWIQYMKTGLNLTSDNCGTNLYCPTAGLTREHVAYMLVKVFNIPMTDVNAQKLAMNDPVVETAQPAAFIAPTILDIFPSVLPLTPLPAPKVQAMPNAVGTAINATFVYDGDGNRVKSTINGVTTYFVGNLYELTGAQITKYYYSGGQRIAMRQGSTLTYMLGDHLGSTSLTTNASGAVISELRYTPWGEVRTQSGVTTTNYTYTGQYSNTADFGLMFYNARWYDPALGRFASADSILPAGAQGYDRYAYVNNNPVKYTDPTGHQVSSDDGGGGLGGNIPYTPSDISSDDEEGDDNGGCPSYDSSCANISYEELETYLNNSFHYYQGSLWAGAVVLGFAGGVVISGCALTGGTAVAACLIGALLIAEAVELTYEANEAGDISSYLHTELGMLNPGEETTISLDFEDVDSNFVELNASNVSYGQNIDFLFNTAMLQLSLNYWNTGQIATFP